MVPDEKLRIAGGNIESLGIAINFHGYGETEIAEDGIENFLRNFEVIHS